MTPRSHPDLQDRLDRAIGEPPPAGSAPDPRLLGRRAVVRRRARLLATAAVVCLAGGGVATLALGPGGDGRAAEVAVEPPAPTATPTPAPAPSAVPSAAVPSATPTQAITRIPAPTAPDDPAGAAQTRLREDHWADYRADGSLELLPDVTIVQRIENPVAADDQSVALELARPGRADAWYLVEFMPGYYPVPTSTTIPARSGGYASLEAWVEAIGGPTSDAPLDQGYGDPVTRAADGTLSPNPGVRILEQRSGVDVGESFAPAADTSAALIRRDGQRLFLLVRTVAGATDITTTPQPLTGATDLDGFLAYAAQKYAGGVR